MKTYIAVLIGIVVLSGAVFGGYKLMNKNKTVLAPQAESVVRMKEFTGKVMREFEGDNTLEYSFEVPESATATVGMDGALIKVLDNEDTYATTYISYEGARGYGPVDYIGSVIASHVSVIDTTSVSKIGDYDWQGAETSGSEWHIASVANGQWLVIVESKKAGHDQVAKTLASFKVK